VLLISVDGRRSFRVVRGGLPGGAEALFGWIFRSEEYMAVASATVV
jgi:hypothetical protein